MKDKVLMFVFNDINIDSRVQRSAETLSSFCDLTLVSCGSSEFYSDKYKSTQFNIKIKSNLVKYFIFVIRLFFLQICKKKYKLIYAHDFFGALPLFLLKVFGKSEKYVYDAHELYIPEDTVKFTIRDKFFYFWEKYAIRTANIVISAHEKRAEIMKNHHKLSEKPLVIRNISIYSETDPPVSDKMKLLNDFLKKEGLTIAYAGAITHDRKIETLVDLIIKSNKKYKMILIGYGQAVDTIKQKIKDSNADNILYLGPMKYKEIPNYLKLCDIGYISYPNKGLNNMYCAPNKIYEYASVGLPMIAPYNPTIEYEFKKYKIGVCNNDLEISLKTITNDLNLYKSYLDFFLKENTWEIESEKLKNKLRMEIKSKNIND